MHSPRKRSHVLPIFIMLGISPHRTGRRCPGSARGHLLPTAHASMKRRSKFSAKSKSVRPLAPGHEAKGFTSLEHLLGGRMFPNLPCLPVDTGWVWRRLLSVPLFYTLQAVQSQQTSGHPGGAPGAAGTKTRSAPSAGGPDFVLLKLVVQISWTRPRVLSASSLC